MLEKQIEDSQRRAPSPARRSSASLSIAIAIAMGLAMLRVLTGISILWFLVPGYTAGAGAVVLRAGYLHGHRL